MAEYVPLQTYGSSSSLGSDVTHYDAESGGRYGRVHPGYGASRLPLRPTSSGAFAGQHHQKIFEGHLGRAAGDPNNPISKWFYNLLYGKPDVADKGEAGLTLPFSNNIGPGNQIAPAKSAADAIAQGHDLHYQAATKDSDVLSADKEAISHFVHEAINAQDPVSQAQATIGAIGLGIKHGVENVIGVQYGEDETS